MKLDRDTSHRIVTYVRQDFAPKDSLLCVPDLCNNVLFLMCNPSPRCCIQVVELLKMRRQYQLGGETSSCLKSQPGFVPLGLHPVKVRSLVLVLHKANLVSIHVEKKTVHAISSIQDQLHDWCRVVDATSSSQV